MRILWCDVSGLSFRRSMRVIYLYPDREFVIWDGSQMLEITCLNKRDYVVVSIKYYNAEVSRQGLLMSGLICGVWPKNPARKLLYYVRKERDSSGNYIRSRKPWVITHVIGQMLLSDTICRLNRKILAFLFPGSDYPNSSEKWNIVSLRGRAIIAEKWRQCFESQCVAIHFFSGNCHAHFPHSNHCRNGIVRFMRGD